MSAAYQYSIIGTGNIAHFLAATLAQQGHSLAGVWARDAAKAADFAHSYPCNIYPSLSHIPDQENHICFLAISDAAIASLALQLNFSHTLLLHCSGATALAAIASAAQNTGVYWPIYAISRGQQWDSNMIPIAIEASNTASLQLMAQLSPKTFVANADTRTHLHLAAVFASNFTNHLYAIAQQLCSQQHIDAQILAPIIAQGIQRLAQQPAIDIQTGPAIRNDQNTLLHQQNLLKNQPHWLAIYQSLSSSIRNTYTKDAD
ncbi:MAG: DUF2520 domain-containing protein [Chitinophagaceae bacterium]|nr:DUF2520 domain-containing protein [Chitinophagaceae bacterium]